ncbi:peptidoglycan-binding protein [Terrabacter sp. NPDC080008]|uniref:peptidoglycan-binding domain-containing protein n=1 Tax=Terrabacter sp. NPDC080008 TaxID=3155176 RepID=UPI00344F5A36
MQGTAGVRGRIGRRRGVAVAATALAAGLALSACGPLTLEQTAAARPTPAFGTPTVTDAPTEPVVEAATDSVEEPLPTVTADPLSPSRPTPATTTPAASVTPVAPAAVPAAATPTSAPTTTAPPTTATQPPPPTGGPGTVEGSCARTLPAYPVLEPGARGTAVRALQCFLDDADFGPVTVDGVYGPETLAAVRRVEAALDGPPPHPGRVDAGRWVMLISRSLGDVSLKAGSTGPDVVTLQRALRAAGATVSVDGRFGSQTKKAVERLQDANRVGADGVVRDETLFLLKMGATIG